MARGCQEGASDGRWVVPFSEGSRNLVDLLGGKGANLSELARLGFPVPPGIVVTTEACRLFLDDGKLPTGLMKQVTAGLTRVEEQLGRRFGDPSAPLLISVRSGAAVSMPGMMNTVLNVGLSRATLDGFARAVGGQAVAADCLLRLMTMYAMAVEGVPAERLRAGDEDAEQALSDVEERFRAETGGPFPPDASEQLERSIAAVFQSWNSTRAQLYRRYHRIPGSGTAVVVQAMVFGNSGARSGTGVAFTRDPSTGERRPFGDYLANAQGEDIVAGSHNTDDLDGMRRGVPEAHAELLQTARLVEQHFREMCEIEFTVEDGRLWLLQSRVGQRSARASVRIAVQLAREGVITPQEAIARVEVDELDALLHPRLDRGRLEESAILTTGVGACPGLARGSVVLDSARAAELVGRGEPVVLVRAETRPDDLEGILAATGLLTTRGGKTSHAAVVTRGLGKPCVCGAEAIAIDADKRRLRIGDTVVDEGQTISIDGDSGLVLRGKAPPVTPTPPAEVDELLAWSDDMRDLRVAALALGADGIRAAIESGADELALSVGETGEDAGTAGGRAALERVLTAVDALAPGRPATLVVPRAHVGLAAELSSQVAPSVEVAAAVRLSERGVNATDAVAIRWDGAEAPAAAAAIVPTLAWPPDLSAQSLALARAIGARAIVVPTDRVAVARLAAAKVGS